jgi:D-alanine-D-alanine ligase
MARVDFLMDKNTNQIYFNEVNTIPGFTRISMYSKLWTASGMEYSQLIDKLIDLALERKADKDQTLRRYEA